MKLPAFQFPVYQFHCLAMVGCLALALCSCELAPPTAQPATSQEFVGTWRLVKAGGKDPTAWDIKSLYITVAADGTFTSTMEMNGSQAGRNMNRTGRWTLADGIVSHISEGTPGTSQARLKSGRLILDPDLTLRRGGSLTIAGEYER